MDAAERDRLRARADKIALVGGRLQVAATALRERVEAAPVEPDPVPVPSEPTLPSAYRTPAQTNTGVDTTTTTMDIREVQSGREYERVLFTYSAGTAAVWARDDVRLYSCAWPDFTLLATGARMTFDRCSGKKLSAYTGASDVLIKDWQSFPSGGADSLGVVQATNVTIDGWWDRMRRDILGPDDHYDALQVRGVNGLTIRNGDLDTDGTDAGSPKGGNRYNAQIFLEGVTFGNRNITIENMVIGAGNKYLFGTATDVRVRDVTLRPIVVNAGATSRDDKPIASGSNLALLEWARVTWADGTPIPQPAQPN